MFTRKNKNQQKKQLSQLNGPLNEFLIFSLLMWVRWKKKTLEPQTNGHCKDLERIVDRATHNLVIGNSSGDKIRKTVDNFPLTVKNCIYNAILTTMDIVVIPRVEIAVRSITGSSGQGPSNVVQNLDRRDPTGNTVNTGLKPAPSRLGLVGDQHRDDGTHNVENFQDGDFPALKLNYDGRAHAHHMIFCTERFLRYQSGDISQKFNPIAVLMYCAYL